VFSFCIVCNFNLFSLLYFQRKLTWMALYSLTVLMCR